MENSERLNDPMTPKIVPTSEKESMETSFYVQLRYEINFFFVSNLLHSPDQLLAKIHPQLIRNREYYAD